MIDSIIVLIQRLQFPQFSTRLCALSFFFFLIRIKSDETSRYQIDVCIFTLDPRQFLKSKRSALKILLAVPIRTKYSTSEKVFRVYFKFRYDLRRLEERKGEIFSQVFTSSDGRMEIDFAVRRARSPPRASPISLFFFSL